MSFTPPVSRTGHRTPVPFSAPAGGCGLSLPLAGSTVTDGPVYITGGLVYSASGLVYIAGGLVYIASRLVYIAGGLVYSAFRHARRPSAIVFSGRDGFAFS